MEDFVKLNVAQICSIESFLKATNSDYVYRKSRRFLFWSWPEGFITNKYYFHTIESIEECPLYYIKDNQVYYKPNIEINMSDGTMHEKYFETEEELMEYVSFLKQKGVIFI